MDRGFVLADGDWKEDIVYGVVMGFLFIAINLLIPEFRIGVPQATLGLAVVLAPLAEELAFRSAIQGIVNNNVPHFWAANIIQATAFSLFHWQAYGMGLQAAFVGAGIFGLVAGYVARERDSILPCIVMHSMFNGWIMTAYMVIIGI